MLGAALKALSQPGLPRQDIQRLGLEVEVDKQRKKTGCLSTTNFELPEELPSVEEEKQLKDLVKVKAPIDVIAGKLSRKPDAVIIKCKRLKLEVVVAKGYTTTTSISMPEELPSVEEALKLFAAISGLSGIVLGIFLGKVWKEKKQDEKKKTLFSGKKSVFSSSLKKTRKRMCAGHCLFLLVNCWFEKEFFSRLDRRRSGGAGRFFFS